MGALLTNRIRAMVLGGLRRREALGLRMQDVRLVNAGCLPPEARAGTGGPWPVPGFASLPAYFEQERPETATDLLFAVLRRGGPGAARCPRA